MKKSIVVGIVIVVVVVGAGVYFLTQGFPGGGNATKDQGGATSTTQSTGNQNVATTTAAGQEDGAASVIGKSVEGRDISAYHYGHGTSTELLFIGGIHGGYEWNTALVAYQMMDYLKANPNVVPQNVQVTVIPVLNPDGLNKTVGTPGRFTQAQVPTSTDATVSGRFNAHTVDLNRNFDCDWQAAGKWQDKTVSGGTAAFSEPESQAIKAYVEAHKPAAVVTWYSSAGGVFASSCHNGVSAETQALTKTYADASGYPAHASFNFYEITGDMVNWLAKSNIPAISVLLTNHTDIEWSKNQAGIDAILKHYAK